MIIRCGHCLSVHSNVDDVIICAFQHGIFTRKKAAWLLAERRKDHGHTLPLPTNAS